MSLLSRTRELMRRFDLRPVKALGQNFLIDENTARKIADAALSFAPGQIIEVGPGLGALTTLLARPGIPVAAYDKDAKLEAPLSELLAGFDNVSLHIGDFLKADIDSLGGPNTVAVGNLPYYITTPILEKLFLCPGPLKAIVVTMQREVADRLRAQPATKDYGSLTVFCRYHMEQIEKIADLGPNVFLPEPGVSSTAIVMVPRACAPEGVDDPERFFAAVRAAFGYRRKTLRKALATAPDLGLTGAEADAVLARAGIDPGRRGETLSFEEFAALGRSLYPKQVSE